jgi:anti-anti-sigma factor
MLALAPGWEMEVDRGPGCLLVKLKGPDRDASDTPPLADELWSLLQRHFVYRLVLEFDEVELLHSYLLGQLVLLDKRIREHDGMLRLCGLSSFNQRVLRVHGLDARLPTYGDVEEALMGRTHKPR